MKSRKKNIKTKKHYILLEPGKEPRFFRFSPKDDFNDNVYKLLNCDCYEHVTCPYNIHLLVDESGAIKELPFNEQASVLYGYNIYGPALVCSLETDTYGEGYFAPLGNDKLLAVLGILSEVKAGKNK